MNNNICLFIFLLLIQNAFMKYRDYDYGSKRLSEPKAKTGKSNLILKRYDNITKSENDPRIYRGLELSNHMRVLLVSDNQTNRSSATLTVNVGASRNPKEIYGLAHFLEHMLFLGTKKYPLENEYVEFITKHSGRFNAGTALDYTSYFFEISSEYLVQALDRFSQFFIAPLFTESATEREINAVNSEYEKNIPDDGRRVDQLNKILANADHPLNTFTTGNKETLIKIPKEHNINVREKLIEFHEKWYSSNIMSLAVLGRESLDELESIVVELFSAVKNKNVELPVWKIHPYADDKFRTKVYAAPVKDLKYIKIVFPGEDFSEEYRSAPNQYTKNLILHQGPGSLSSILKARGWTNSGVRNQEFESVKGSAFFGIDISLTDEGLDHIDDIVKLVFQYINLIKKEGPQKWVQEEIKNLLEMRFKFKDIESPLDYINTIARGLHLYPMEHILNSAYLRDQWRPDLLEKLWSNFVPEKVRLFIIAKKFENDLNQTEHWYGTKYRVDNIPEATIKEWQEAGLSPDLKLPEKNEYITTDFGLYPLEKDVSEFPVIIKDTALTRLWYKQDDQYFLPKTYFRCNFVSPVVYIDPSNCNLFVMFNRLLLEVLNEHTYTARVAGYNWNLLTTTVGLSLNVNGYTSKQHILLKKIMEKLINLKIDPKVFNITKELYIENMKNIRKESPLFSISSYLDELLEERIWTVEERLAVADDISMEKLEKFIPQIFTNLRIECLAHGNINKEKALELTRIIEDDFNSLGNITPMLPKQLLPNREVKLERGSDYSFEIENNIFKPSAISIYFQCGLQSTEDNMKLQLIQQILSGPCFTILRTKEQLGYSVGTAIRKTNSVQGLRISVLSDKHPDFLDTRIEAFLESMLTYIHDMNEEDFAAYREGLANRLLDPPKQMASLSATFWSEINTKKYNFNRANIEVAYLKKLSKNDIVDYFKEMISSKGENRRKISVKIISVAEGGAGRDETKKYNKTAAIINDIMAFRSTHELSALVQPYQSFIKEN